MVGINNVHLSGYIVKGPHRLAIPNKPDEVIIEFMVGIPDDERKDYICCICKGELAAEALPKITPGAWAYLEGRLISSPQESQIYRDPTLKLNIDALDIPYPRSSKSGGNSHDGHGQQTNEQSSVVTPTEFTDDDIPWK